MRPTRTAISRTAILSALLAASLSSAAFAAAPIPNEESNPTAEQPGTTQTDTVSEQPPENPNVSGGTLPLLPEAETPPVARGVAVEELPLLVTEPPKEADDVEIPVPVTGGKDSVLNPFSPLLLPQPPQQAAEPAPPAPTPQAAQQPAQQPTPAVTAPPVVAPAPSVAAPPKAPVPLPQARISRPALPGSLAANLRTTVPLRADLSATPLPRALNTQMGDVNALGPASELAAVRTPPNLSPLDTAPAEGAAAARIPSGAQQVALGSGLSTLGLSGGFGGGNGAGDGNFTSLAGNRVSRALSSLQVHFTAMTTGTAIFRLGDDTTPLLLAPGEALPGTQLILTALTNGGAQFTEDDVRHTLFLAP